MTWILHSGSHSLELCPWTRREATQVRDRQAARLLLARYASSWDNVRVMRLALAAQIAPWSVAAMTDAEVIEGLSQEIARGALRTVRAMHVRLTSFDLGDTEPEEAPASVAPAEEATTWIEIELVDHDDRPVPFEPYEVDGPSGRTIRGTLDGRGFARVTGVPYGATLVRFPRRDVLDWHPASTARSDDPFEERVSATTWIEIELVDHDGRLVAGERYEVVDAAGIRFTGTLEEDGSARIEGVLAGRCRVSFPDRGPDDWTILDVERAEDPLDPVNAAPVSWIEIELIDDDGRAVGGEPYEVRLPDGATIAGSLDASGRARIDGVPRGAHEITFPERDAAEWSRA